MQTPYDTIGIDYANLRKPDARIMAAILRALGPAQTILNVGAGSGSYEPDDREVTALEPSIEMIHQRKSTAAAVVQGYAEALPFRDRSFDAAMAVLTVHHWKDKPAGLREMRRVARGPVAILTFDPQMQDYWLAKYFPEFVTLDIGIMPPMEEYAKWLGPVQITPVPVPHDCSDGFLGAYWRRPAAYLDPKVRAALSSFWAARNVTAGLERLEADLNSGRWEERNGALLRQETYDFGYRLVSTTAAE